MTENAGRDCFRCPTFDAVQEYARSTFASLARRTVFKPSRIPATGLFEDFRHKSLWDEYCHEVQEGPYLDLESSWDFTIGRVLDEVISAVPVHEQKLLTIGAKWSLESEDFEGESEIPIDPGLMSEHLGQLVLSLAGGRDLERFRS